MKYHISPQKNIIGMFVFILFCLLPISVHGATFTVDSTLDQTDASAGNGTCASSAGNCTIRAAIQEANALAGDDIVSIPAGTYTLSISGSGENVSGTGDLDINSNISIIGAGASSTIIDGNDLDRIFHVFIESVTATISDLTVQNGSLSTNAKGMGIGIENATSTVTIQRVTVQNNTGTNAQGGGIYVSPATLVTIEDSTIYNNSVSGTSNVNGAGIYVANATVSITGSTISYNSNTASGGFDGGGIIASSSGVITITNSTISNNNASSGSGGGIAAICSNPNITISNSTIANNTGGGVFLRNGCGGTTNAVSIKGSIITNNTVGASSEDCETQNSLFIQSSGYNVLETNCAGYTSHATDVIGQDPFMAAPNLGSNGGPTQTIALQEGSPALDLIPSVSCTDIAGSPVTVDQRGFTRPDNAACDSGAYERDQTAPTITITDNTEATNTVECSVETFTDPGATATDADEDLFGIPPTVNTAGTVDESTLGTQDITYTADDQTGNQGEEMRVVTVEDTTNPTITRTGNASVSVNQGQTYTDSGATATDLCDSTLVVNTTNPVNTSVPGTYTVTYTTTDDSGNSDTETRTVTVTEVDVDADGADVLEDCNDTDSTVSVNQTYYQDADTDTLGNAAVTTSVCSSTAPTGYVSNNTDTNDNDADNDGTETELDCNDADATLQTNQTYYQDLDGDTLGNVNVATSVCSLTAPAGYVSNSSDTDDTESTETEEETIEIGGDGIDNDGDGAIDEVNTSEENGVHPEYGTTDPTNTDSFSSVITSYEGGTNGTILITYADGSIYRYTIFDIETDSLPLLTLYPNSGYLLVLHPKGKSLTLVNPYTGEVIHSKALAKKPYGKHFFTVATLRNKTAIVVLSKKRTQLNLSLLTLNLTTAKFKKHDSETWKKKMNKKVNVGKTAVKKKAILLKNTKGKTIQKVRVSPKLQIVL